MGSSIYPVLAPGITTPRTASHRIVFHQRGETYFGGGLVIDGALSRDTGNTGNVDVLRSGLLLGKVTATNRLATAILGVTTGATLAGATSITAAAAIITELVRRVGASGTFKLTGPPTANGVVATETVTYSAASGTTITCTATANAYVIGSFIQPTDGSETPITFVDDLGQYGIQVTDGDGNSVTAIDFPRPPITGVIQVGQLLPAWPTDTSLQAWIFARLNDSGGNQYIRADRMTG